MNPYEDVKQFHLACNHPVLSTPQIPSPARVALRKALIKEEIAETLKGIADENLPEIADGICDAIYVLVGTALEYGIPLPMIWKAVQQSNMQKTTGGKCPKTGKQLKPPGWEPPDIERILNTFTLYSQCKECEGMSGLHTAVCSQAPYSASPSPKKDSQ